MAFSNFFAAKNRWLILFRFTFLLILTGQPVLAIAANTAQPIISESMEAMWTGREFSPELKQRQQTLKTMMENSTVTKAELTGMIKAAFSSLMEHQITSRYAIKAMSERIDALFSPQINWKEIREIMWRVGSAPAKKDNPIMMTIGTLAPPGTPWIDLPETKILPELKALTDGKVLVKIYGAGVLGDDTDVLKKMNNHQIDGCGCTALGVLEACPEASVLLLPGLFRNYEEVDYILEKFRKTLDQAFEKKGYVLSAIIDTGFLYLFSKNKINSLDDLRKQKVMAWFGAMETNLYQELGVDASPGNMTEVASALNMGQADTVLLPPVWVLGMQVYQYMNFYIKPPLLYSPAAIFVSDYTQERLQKQIGVSDIYAENIKEMLVYEFNAAETEWKQQLRNYEAKSLKAFETKCGINPITLSEADQQRLLIYGIAVQQQQAGKTFPKALMDDILKALEEYRSTH